jgi:putative membrane protein
VIVKHNLSARRVLEYTAAPMAWASVWAVLAPVAFTLTDDPRLILPFPAVATLAGALAIFVAFRNNSAFARWNEARAAWQTVLVASRTLTRQIIASTRHATATGSITEEQASEVQQHIGELLAEFAWTLAAATRPNRVSSAARPTDRRPDPVLIDIATAIKDGIRTGALGQFDPISTEPQLVALNNAQGAIERIATTPTLRQYDYFTRRLIELFAVIAPFALLGLLPDAVWLTTPLALILAGTFVVLAVTGAANDEPFANRVTDVPIDTICRQLEHDVLTAIGDPDPPRPLQPVDGYLW